jgi:hypothetical protein
MQALNFFTERYIQMKQKNLLGKRNIVNIASDNCSGEGIDSFKHAAMIQRYLKQSVEILLLKIVNERGQAEECLLYVSV